jgi:hypothetical protein
MTSPLSILEATDYSHAKPAPQGAIRTAQDGEAPEMALYRAV